MATAPVITGSSVDTNSFVTITFTSAGATSEKLYLERSVSGVTSPDWITVRSFTRGTATSALDLTAPPADLTVQYRIRATDVDGSGTVYSNTFNVVLTCMDFSSVSAVPPYGSQLRMLYATSRNSSRGRSTTIHKFAGRKDPVAEKSIQRSNSVDISWICMTWTEVEQYMDLMLNGDFWYRDNSGRSFHAVCSDIQVSDSQVLNQFTLSTTLTRIDGGVQN